MPRLLAAVALLACLAVQAQTVTIRDTIGRDYVNEPVLLPVHIPATTGRAQRPTILRDGTPIASQLLSSPDLAPEHYQVLVLIDALAKGGSTELTVTFGGPQPEGTPLQVTASGQTADRSTVLENGLVALRLPADSTDPAVIAATGPIMAVRLPDGAWVGGSRYAVTDGPAPTQRTVVVTENGPVRLRAVVTTTFGEGRSHVVTVSLLLNSRSIDIAESFNLGPDSTYRYKQYGDDRDELAWEWWSWYGDREGLVETHPNNWVFTLSEAFGATFADIYGSESTDSAKGKMLEGNRRGRSSYSIPHHAARRFEKYLSGHCQWRPDGLVWYIASQSEADDAQAVGIYTHSPGNWQNPNVLPLPSAITLRTGANDMRLVSYDRGKRLELECPIGLGERHWAIRPSTRGESLAPETTSPHRLLAERVRRSHGLEVTRHWVTAWDMDTAYPRLFVPRGSAQAGAQAAALDAKAVTTALHDAHELADRMIEGWIGHGFDNTSHYPAWMMGYWSGIVVAGKLDEVAGSPHADPESVRALKAKLAILTYCLTSPHAWPDKRSNYGWGSMNMPVGRWGGLVVMASANSDHPNTAVWLKDAGRYFRMLLRTEYHVDGTQISCPHYIGASSTSFYAWIVLQNAGAGIDLADSVEIERFARYYMQLMKPIDPRWDMRILLNEGDTRPGSSPIPAILATLLQAKKPELAGQLMTIWREGGSDLTGGMGIPDARIIDQSIASRPLELGPQVFPGFGAILRYGRMSTPDESYLAMLGGNFMIDHANTDQLAFAWHAKGVPLSVLTGDMYQPGARSGLSHNTVVWDVVPGGAEDPGEGQEGNWFHDTRQPWVDSGGKTPRLHHEITWHPEKQAITDMRGMITHAVDAPDAALLEGQVDVQALTQIATRSGAGNFDVLNAAQNMTPVERLETPFTWTRRLLYVKGDGNDGMTYIVIRDDFGGWSARTPHFSYWSLSNAVAVDGATARFPGQLGVDTDLVVLQPAGAAIATNVFTHQQCEGNVQQRHRARYGESFSETQHLARVQGRPGEGFLVVLFPYKPEQGAPVVTPWADGAGATLTWQGETHHVLLDTKARQVKTDGIVADTSALVVKRRGAQVRATLPAGGSATVDGTAIQPGGVDLLQAVPRD